MRISRSFNRKLPTEQEIRNFVPHRGRDIWLFLDESWRCPVCGRGKRELMRWRKGTGGSGQWTCSLHLHHDHGDRWTGRRLVCGDCNAADGIAKRLLKLPSSWSFSPDELASFVKCEPNGSIESVDLDTAWDIFERYLQDAYTEPVE